MKPHILFMAATVLSAATVVSCCRNTPREQAAQTVELKDYGAAPTVLPIERYTLANDNFRTAIWTGDNLQVTVMSIPIGCDVGLEQHNGLDQFLRIEQGKAEVRMGDSKENLDFVVVAVEDDAILIPSGKWHNVLNKGDNALKLYSIYAPGEHPHGTVHRTQQEAFEAEGHH